MRLKKSFQLALNILLHSRLRSWLTIIGIVIGIAAVVSIVSISQGAQQSLEASLGELGADILTVTLGFSMAEGSTGTGMGMGRFKTADSETSTEDQENLTAKDVLVLKNIGNVDFVMGEVSDRGDLIYSSKTASLSVKGVDISVWKDVSTEQIAEGRFLGAGDSYSVVLGGTIVSSTFEDGIPLNSKVTIEGKSFKVVGILESGNTIYMPIEVARTTFEDIGDKEFDTIYVKIEDVEIADATVEDIIKKLMFSRGTLTDKDRDFTVTNPADRQEAIQETMQTMTLFLTAIAAISLLVGAVGIANTMFTSVLEKTKEIGIMKAIGAKNKDILLIFLFNAGLIGFVGGLGGVILGYFGSGLVSSMGSSGGMTSKIFGTAVVTPELLIGALLFSVIIGMVAGAIPAYNASRMNPVDALRYE